MKNLPLILEQLKTPPGLITIRHPGRFETPEDTVNAIQRIKPWMNYAIHTPATLLVSFFQFHEAARDELMAVALGLPGNHSITKIDRPESKFQFYDYRATATYAPDAFAFKIN